MFAWSWGAQWTNSMGRKATKTNRIAFRKNDSFFLEKTKSFKSLTDCISDSFSNKKQNILFYPITTFHGMLFFENVELNVSVHAHIVISTEGRKLKCP